MATTSAPAPTADPLAQLYDIEGLDALSVWPLAIGWWLLLAVLILMVAVSVYFYFKSRQRRTSGQFALRKHLDNLQQRPIDHSVAIEISELIRRIAIHSSSRSECAGLEGSAWLRWLQNHDPNGFDWQQKGQWITTIPYAPASCELPATQITATLQAIRGWLR